ncbi:MAG TPA: alpha/beta fold hydrolase, partial [Microlunatus sp.]|nr:alpha/beta fold hydrolase [Microlunatus sp.]
MVTAGARPAEAHTTTDGLTELVGGRPGAADQLPGVDAAWSRYLTVTDGDRIPRRWHVLDNGAQPSAGTLLCLHGNPTWSYLWRRFLAAAPPGWRVIAPDQLGMGWSDRTQRPRTLAERVDDLNRVTAALGLSGPTVVVAHDWGGPIALGWAVDHRAQVRGLVLTNTGVAFPAGTGLPPLIRLARSAALRELACVRTSAFVRGAPALSSPLPAEAVRRALRAPYRDPERRRAIGDFVADIPAEADHPSRAELARIAGRMSELADVPALLLWGARDPIFTEAFLHDLELRLPRAAVHRYPRASHLVTEDVPELAQQVWRWIGQRPPEPAPAVSSSDPGGDAAGRLGSRIAERAGSEAPAIVELRGRRTVTTSWAELERRVGTAADRLRAVGVRPGSRVALLVPPGARLTATAYACWRVGASIVVADAGLGLRSLGNALRSAAPASVVGIPAALV